MAEFLTPEEADKLLKLPRGRAKRLAKRGKLPAVTLPDGTVRIPRKEFEQWLRKKALPEEMAETVDNLVRATGPNPTEADYHRAKVKIDKACAGDSVQYETALRAFCEGVGL